MSTPHPVLDESEPALPIDPLVARLTERFAQPVSGYAYGKTLRLSSCVITVLGVLFAFFALLSGDGPTYSAAFVPVAVAVGMTACCWFIATGQTVINHEGISQQWIMPKTFRWDEIFRVRLLKLPLNTRLMLNTGRPPFKTIHAGTPELARAFEEVAELYKVRNPR